MEFGDVSTGDFRHQHFAQFGHDELGERAPISCRRSRLEPERDVLLVKPFNEVLQQ